MPNSAFLHTLQRYQRLARLREYDSVKSPGGNNLGPLQIVFATQLFGIQYNWTIRECMCLILRIPLGISTVSGKSSLYPVLFCKFWKVQIDSMQNKLISRLLTDGWRVLATVLFEIIRPKLILLFGKIQLNLNCIYIPGPNSISSWN